MRSTRFLVIIFGVSTLLFWVLLGMNERILLVPHGPTTIIEKSILKFLFYINILIWFNMALELKTRAEGIDTETGEFQRQQVKMTLWIVSILILMELPLWLGEL